jgi:hypothetical protein
MGEAIPKSIIHHSYAQRGNDEKVQEESSLWINLRFPPIGSDI